MRKGETRRLDAEAGLAPVSTLGVVTVVKKNMLALGGGCVSGQRMAAVCVWLVANPPSRPQTRGPGRVDRIEEGMEGLFLSLSLLRSRRGGARTEWCYRFGDESTGG